MKDHEACPINHNLRTLPWYVTDVQNWNALWDLACTFNIAYPTCPTEQEELYLRDCDD